MGNGSTSDTNNRIGGSKASGFGGGDKKKCPRKPRSKNRKKQDDDSDPDEPIVLTADGKMDYDYIYLGVASPGSYEVKKSALPKGFFD